VRTAKSIQKGEATAKPDGEAWPQDHVKTATRAIYAAIDRLGHVEGVPDKKALMAFRNCQRMATQTQNWGRERPTAIDFETPAHDEYNSAALHGLRRQ
jgi:hypothetical protein